MMGNTRNMEKSMQVLRSVCPRSSSGEGADHDLSTAARFAQVSDQDLTTYMQGRIQEFQRRCGQQRTCECAAMGV